MCFTMRIVQWVPILLILIINVYVCIVSGYAQTNNYCGLERFQCRNGECIADELLCDGRADCKDSSDETEAECKKPEILCPPYTFRCNYGGCINEDCVCNGVQDCLDNSDETQPQCMTRNITNATNNQMGRPAPCETDQVACANGQCIYNADVCDGIRDCADDSDETVLCRLLPCPLTAFRCFYGACIDRGLRCNTIRDCADGSDEDSRLCESLLINIPPITTGRPSTITTLPATTPKRSSVTPGTNTCKAPPQPQNGRWQLHQSQCPNRQECNVAEGTELGLGSHLVYSCNPGYKIEGPTNVSCSFEGKWLIIPVCTEILCKALNTASVRAVCTYNDERISCESPVPSRTQAELECQNFYQPAALLSGQSKRVRCNANGQWEPEPMQCIPECGTIRFEATVVGGVRPNITEFPWHASMYRDVPGKPKEFFCGASIIQENLLITAAHCVYDEITRQPIDASKIYISTGNLFRDYDYPYHDTNIVKRNRVKRIYIIRSYLGLIGNYVADIAILELVTPFVLSTLLVPICIDTSSDKSVLEPGTYGKVAGFGRTEFGESSAVLQALTVPVISLSQCRSASQSAQTEQFITYDKFCAGYMNGSAACDGDSGGGLFFEFDDGSWYLRGIVSVALGTIQDAGNIYCDNNLYSLYTEISRHLSWIQDVITKIRQNQTQSLCLDEFHTRCS